MSTALSRRSQDLVAAICVDEQCSRHIFDETAKQLRRGLAMHEAHPNTVDFSKSDFMMLDSGITKTPTGREKGTFYGIDMGGSNVRAIRVVLNGDRHVHETSETGMSLLDVPFAKHCPRGVLDPRATATELFDGVVYAVRKLMGEHGELDEQTGKPARPVGFTCSFGLNQRKLDSAVLTQWSKGIETGDLVENKAEKVIGQDILGLVNGAFKRNKINAYMNCIVNDTVATLITGSYQDNRTDAAKQADPAQLPPCRVGVIIGTGFNICYYEPDAQRYNYRGYVINTECGGLKGAIPRIAADALVDFHSTNKGHQIAEKAISGLYLGEVIRYALLDILQQQAPESLWRSGTISTAKAAQIFNAEDWSAASVAETAALWFGRKADEAELTAVKAVVDAVFVRSARIVGSMVAAFVEKTDRSEGVTVGVDGSLYTKNPKFQLELEHCMQRLVDPKDRVVLTPVVGGSGTGAALLAACTAH